MVAAINIIIMHYQELYLGTQNTLTVLCLNILFAQEDDANTTSTLYVFIQMVYNYQINYHLYWH